jgi:hypothetical protein
MPDDFGGALRLEQISFWESSDGPAFFFEQRKGRTALPGSTARTMPSKKTVRMGTKAKPLSAGGAGGFAVLRSHYRWGCGF